MVESWIEFIAEVSYFLKEAKLKNSTTSVRLFECVSEKLEHCIRNITKTDGTCYELEICCLSQ